MNNRVTMNSESLQKNFPKIYREIFSNCNIVISSPRSFCWTGSIADRYGCISLSQLLPLRTYVGIQRNNIGINQILTYKSFSIRNQQFTNDIVLDSYKRKKIAELIVSKIFEFTGKRFNHNYDIHILSELPLKNVGSTSSILSSLTFAILTDLNYLSLEEISTWPNQNPATFKENKKFDGIFKFIWSLRRIFSDSPNPIGRSVFTCLFNSNFPILFTHRESKKTIDNLSSLNSTPQNINQINYWGDALDHVFKIEDKMPSWNIDFGLFDVENYYTPDSGMLYVQETDLYLTNLKNFLQHDIKQLVTGSEEDEKPYFWNLVKDNEIDIYKNYLKIFIMNSFDFIRSFKYVFDYGATESQLSPLIKSINKFNDIIQLINRSSDKDNFLINNIRNKYSFFDNINNIGLKLACGSKGGLIIFTGYKRKISTFVEQLVQNESTNSGFSNINLAYASWIDGIGHEGIKTEQALSKNIVSNFISAKTIRIDHYQNNQVTKKILPSEQIADIIQNNDLIIDEKNNHIYIAGNKLTSKDLHSTTATIEIIKILLKNIGKNISNDQLPDLSYTQERGELQSKIISPLIKATKKYTDKNLYLKISGSLTNFSVTLKPNDVTITLIKK